MIRKVVITAAGLGTRLLPATKEQPKEMLPIFARGVNEFLCLKPFLQLVFENLYCGGFRDFCFIVGRAKRSIEDHFTIDNSFIKQMSHKNKSELVEELINFYEKVGNSNIVFVNQPEPKGFGDAVYHAKSFTCNESFLVHAGDDLILSEGNRYLKRLMQVFESYKADAILCVQKVENPRRYGVITGKKIDTNLYKVTRIEEKPSFPASNLATIGIYVFSPKIYHAIEETTPDANNEIQLTNAIQHLINEKCAVYALELDKKEKRMDIGTPESYWNMLKITRKYLLQYK
jgi:UTP--glucose-1-phosphate uridylyltransferase